MQRPTAKHSLARATAQGGPLGGLRPRGVSLHLTPRGRRSEAFDHVNGLHPWKRGLDVTLSVGALVLLAPLAGVVAALVKMTSEGPVFVSQERVGLNRRVADRRKSPGAERIGERRGGPDRREALRYGRPFKMYKFRSMRNDAEGVEPVWATEDDPRITALGRMLRKTRIDEIPQFVNVLRGDMSVVGPRPEREYFYGQLEQEIPEFPRRLRAKPGITGLAQVNNGYTNSVAGSWIKLRHDLEYIQNLRPSTDAKILLKTVSVVVTGKGAC